MILLLPNSGDVDYTDPSDLENNVLNYPANVNSFLFKTNKIDEGKVEIDIVDQVDENQQIMDAFDIRGPAFQLNGESLKVVKLYNELLMNLDLSVRYSGSLGFIKETPFMENLVYESESKRKFKDLILNKGGYLQSESNYFEVDQEHLSKRTKLTTLRNCRVSVFWREIELSDIQIKRIISLGLCYLLDVISKAELVFAINSEIRNETFLVSVFRIDKSYVRIGIEAPVFKY